jgi:hypothetical protein
MSRSYTSSPPCASIGVLWDCFYLLGLQVTLSFFLRVPEAISLGMKQSQREADHSCAITCNLIIYSVMRPHNMAT